MWLVVGSVVLLVVAFLFIGFFMMQGRQTWAMAQVFKGGGVCELDLPKNVCQALPSYCIWDTSNPSDIECRTKT